MVMNQKGQVFLMAAIIIAGLLFALTRLSNKGFARDEPEAFYDLADEIGFETKRVLDYGVINAQPPGITASQAGQLLGGYAEYVAREDVVFIYGDLNSVFAVYYDTINTITAIQLPGNMFIQLQNIVTPTPIFVQSDPAAGTATVRIRGNDYTFKLKTGQNFYFVLIKEDENEQFVALE